MRLTGKLSILSFIASLISFLIFISSIWILDSLSFSDPPLSSIALAYDPRTNAGGVAFDNFTPGVILFLAVNYIVVALFGYSLASRFFSGVLVSYLVKLISSFFIGYTCIIGIIRILSLALPYRHIYWPTMVAMLVLTFILLYRRRPDWKRWVTGTLRSYKGIILTIIIASLFTFLMLLLQIYFGGMSWVGHGYYQYSTLLNDYRANNILHFPIITQHYEELIFHYFLTMPLKLDFNPILPWWITLALTKASILLFLYSAFRKVGVSFYLSSIFSFFMMMGTTSLVIERSYVMIDAGNPINLICHPGRMVQIGFAVMLIMDAIYRPQKNGHLPKIFFLLCGLGLAATSVSNIVWLMPLYVITVAYVSFYKEKEAHSLPRGQVPGGKLICYMAVAAALLLYGIPFSGQNVYILRMLAVFFVLSFYLHKTAPQIYEHVALWKNRWQGYIKELWVRVFILIGSGCASLVFMGNVFVDNKIARFTVERLGNIFGKITVESTTGYASRDASSVAIGDFRQNGAPYNAGLPQFAAAFGGILAIILATMYMLERGRKKGIHEIGHENVLYEIFVLSAVSIPCVLFFMDFMNIHSYTWLLSRFMEIPLYMILFTFLYSINRFCSRPLKFMASIALLAYSIVPFIANHRVEQLMANWRIFVNLLNSTGISP